MKYTGKYWFVIAPFMKKPMAKRYGKKSAKEYIKKAKSVYRQMLNEADDIGAKNPMAHNMYMSFVFMAIWKAADGAITPDDMREMTRELLSMKIVQKAMGGLDVNRHKDMEKFRAKLDRCAKWAEDNPEYTEKTWDFNQGETPQGKGIAYYFTRCPLNDYARKFGYQEILPVMCELDFILAKLYHADLYRKHTLAEGGTVCDYLYLPDKDTANKS
ncbi:MAG: L-2-amino-thiazoline-4-carboxylic acid hydrolase [Clostridia bacterium]|nr:L-2-amino-thiazoline-4-carboxylic acid hydrolase [Clostridia bacterium]